MASAHEQIAEWVTNHGDNEFYLSENELSESEKTWASSGKSAVYCPKSASLLSRLTSRDAEFRTRVIGAYGIPVGARRQWLLDASRSNAIKFFGDLDGPDLMAYASLVDDVASEALEYLGISDSLLARFSVPLESLRWCLMPASAAERAAIAALPDMGVSIDAVVGEGCASLLRAGSKVEIEGLLWEIPADDLLASVLSTE